MHTRNGLLVWVCILMQVWSNHSFVVHTNNNVPVAALPSGGTHCKYQGRPMLPDASSMIAALEVFDGSTIVDPVVVSDVFWASLKGKIIAILIGQALATVAFGLLSWFLSSQISQLGGFVAQSFSSKDSSISEKNPPSKFMKANEIPSFIRPAPDFGKLLICLAIDILGSSSEVIPFLGEVTDILYAPIAATVLRNLYGNNNILFGLEFAEEILPFTDILPLATICWVVDTYLPESDIAKLLKLGSYSSKRLQEDSIDVTAEVSKSWKDSSDRR